MVVSYELTHKYSTFIQFLIECANDAYCYLYDYNCKTGDCVFFFKNLGIVGYTADNLY
jgi:hypothetical protein